MTSTDYTVALALEDYLPVLLALAGFWLLAPDWLGRVGAVLIGLGGLAKSTWKLLLAAGGVDVPWLEVLLFPLMAAGAVLLCAALHKSLGWPAWPYFAAGGVAAVATIVTWSVQPSFLLATVLVIMISVLGAIIAGRHGNSFAMLLYPIGILAVLALVPLRGHPSAAALAFQWLQQGTNTIAQATFFLAAYLTHRSVRSAAPDPEPVPA
jgi:hypothetical protein